MKKLLALLFGFFCVHTTNASHLTGGEISYKCLGGGNFRFTIAIYRDCSGAPFTDSSISLDGPVPVVCNLIGAFDMSPSCLTSSTYACQVPSTTQSGRGGLGKFVFEGYADLSALAPAPASGYVWHTTNISCCRNRADNVNFGNGAGMTLRLIMYPFFEADSNRFLNPAEVCDNSPDFLEVPNNIEIVNPFDTVIYHGLGRDPDYEDELRYTIDLPWSTPFQPGVYDYGYTISNPFPGILNPQTIDSMTGIITYQPLIAGEFTSVIHVSSIRAGQRISSIYRDFQFCNVVNPSSGTLPFSPAYLPGSQQYLQQQKSPIIEGSLRDPVSGMQTRTLRMAAGDTMVVSFTIKDSFPALPAYNTISAYVLSDVLGANGTDATSGCNQPPCAIIEGISPTPAVSFISHRDRQHGSGFVSVVPGDDINGRIVWATVPQHTIRFGRNGPVPYYFGVFAFDDNCVIIGRNAEFFEVIVYPNLITLPAVPAICLSPQGSQGITIRWDSPVDSVTIDMLDAQRTDLDSIQQLARSVSRRRNSFVAYKLYRETVGSTTGMQLLTTIRDLDSTSYLDAAADPQELYAYKIETISSLDTTAVQTAPERMRPVPQVSYDRPAMTYTLFWSTPYTGGQMPATFQEKYFIYQRNLNQGPSAWQLIDSVSVNTSYTGSFTFSPDTLEFEVRYEIPGSCAIEHSERTRFAFDQSLSVTDGGLNSLQVYPNPAGNLLKVSLGTPLTESGKASIYDMQGRLVWERILQAENNSVYTLEIGMLAKGSYNLLISTPETQTGRTTFIKE